MDGRTEREEFAQLTTSLTSMLTNLCRVVLVVYEYNLVHSWPPCCQSAKFSRFWSKRGRAILLPMDASTRRCRSRWPLRSGASQVRNQHRRPAFWPANSGKSVSPPFLDRKST